MVKGFENYLGFARKDLIELLEQEEDIDLKDLEHAKEDASICGNLVLRVNYIRHQYQRYRAENPAATFDNDERLYGLLHRLCLITPPFILTRKARQND